MACSGPRKGTVCLKWRGKAVRLPRNRLLGCIRPPSFCNGKSHHVIRNSLRELARRKHCGGRHSGWQGAGGLGAMGGHTDWLC